MDSFEQISNLAIRFSWIIYLPHRGLPFDVRSFIVAMLEMLRRWQWNFRKPLITQFVRESNSVDLVRLENEHLGNIDQYRATRDVPLPYVFDSSAHDLDNEDWDQPGPNTRGWIGRILKL
jgi:hypothetical protein